MIYAVGLAVVALLMIMLVVLRRRRRGAGRSPSMPLEGMSFDDGLAAASGVLSPAEPAAVPEPGESVAERRERLLWTAFQAGDIPACWYRQQMAVIAAETADQEPRV